MILTFGSFDNVFRASGLWALVTAWLVVELLITPPTVDADEPKPTTTSKSVWITLTVDDQDGLLDVNQPATVTAVIENRSDQKIEGKLVWKQHTVAFDPPDVSASDIVLPANQSTETTLVVSIPRPGFTDVECRIEIGSDSVRSRRFRLGRQPREIETPLTTEPDFDQFWVDSLSALASTPSEFEVAPKPEMGDAKVDVFEVTMRSSNDVHVRGWLEVPKPSDGDAAGANRYPAVIRVPGYGSNMKPIRRWNDMVVFSFNPRGHGNSVDEVPGKPVDYWIRGLDDKETYFYRGAYLDCVRAVSFLATRDDVDQDRIAVWGGSQGGGFAFATAALDPRVDLCVADIPFMCDWINYFRLTVWPEMNQWIDAKETRSWESTLRTLSYFDTLNLASRIECPTYMSVGLQDAVCPPTTCFAVFNRIATDDKSYDIYRDRGHGLGQSHYAKVWQWIRQQFDLQPAP